MAGNGAGVDDEEGEGGTGSGALTRGSRWVQGGKEEGEGVKFAKGGKRSRWEKGGEEEEEEEEGGGDGARKGAPAMRSRWASAGDGEGGGVGVSKKQREALRLADDEILSELNNALTSSGGCTVSVVCNV